MSDQSDSRQRAAEAAATARKLRLAKQLSGKRVVLPDVDSEAATAMRSDIGRAGLAREVAKHGGAGITEESLRAQLSRDESEAPRARPADRTDD